MALRLQETVGAEPVAVLSGSRRTFCVEQANFRPTRRILAAPQALLRERVRAAGSRFTMLTEAVSRTSRLQRLPQEKSLGQTATGPRPKTGPSPSSTRPCPIWR